MRGVTVKDVDARGLLAFDLRDILRLLPGAGDATWTLRGVEATGPGAHALHAACDANERMSGRELIRLAAEVDQTIDGCFTAMLDDAPEPWVVVQAVDSSAFDVYSYDPTVLNAVEQRFRDVHAIDDRDR